jgi:hypothetical protein
MIDLTNWCILDLVFAKPAISAGGRGQVLPFKPNVVGWVRNYGFSGTDIHAPPGENTDPAEAVYNITA